MPHKTKAGYIQIYVPYNKVGLQHRIIMEKYLGRKLSINEVVHHKNGIKHDNRIENLEIMARSTHQATHRTTQRHCNFNKCEDVHFAKGFCMVHYTRNKNHGSPNITLRIRRYNGERCIKCFKEAIRNMMCSSHYYKQYRLLKKINDGRV